MNYEILYPGAFPLIKVNLKAGEMIKAESDAMVSMSSTVDVNGSLDGGIMAGIGRVLSGEKFFFQTLKATRGEGEVLLAPAIPGDVAAVELDGTFSLIVQKDGFLAGTEGIEVESKMQNLVKGLFSGEGFFVLTVRGKGTVFLSSYGAIHAIELKAGEERIIDNSHLVAWSDTTSYTIHKASSSFISSLTSGEMLVCRFRGPGDVLIQSRNPKAFGEWIKKQLPPK